MPAVIDVVLLVVGGATLYFGAEWLVAGASALALSFAIPRLIVGLTVVAYGTSAPEAIVGIQASWSGHGEVAIGNVIGSNIANLGLILGLSAALRQLRVDPALRRRELPVLLGTALILLVVLRDGRVRWWEAALLLASAVGYTSWTARTSRASQAPTDAVVGPRSSRLRAGLRALAGLALLLAGSHLLVRGATSAALALGVSDRVVGLTVVALGTSLPELVTSVVASIRGHADLAIGNVIGSNVFNILVCLGCAALAGPVQAAPATFRVDLLVMLGMTAVAAAFLRGPKPMQRWNGLALAAGYAAYMSFLASSTP